MKKEQTTVDIDFAEAAVPQYARRGIVTMFMIMLGFTFFSASSKGIASINGMIVAAVCYLIGHARKNR